MKAFIIHGSNSGPEKIWFPWLKKHLEKNGIKAIVPRFPTPDNHNLEIWMELFEKYFHSLDEETILIGHGVGCPFILSVLEKIETKVKACFFVAAFYQKLKIPAYKKINNPFVEKEFMWKKIKQNCNEFILLYSDDDPYITIDQPDELQEKLNGTLVFIQEAGHFDDVEELPQLLERIIEI